MDVRICVEIEERLLAEDLVSELHVSIRCGADKHELLWLKGDVVAIRGVVSLLAALARPGNPETLVLVAMFDNTDGVRIRMYVPAALDERQARAFATVVWRALNAAADILTFGVARESRSCYEVDDAVVKVLFGRWQCTPSEDDGEDEKEEEA